MTPDEEMRSQGQVQKMSSMSVNTEATASNVISTIEPYEFYDRNVILTQAEAKDLELKTCGQATSNEWHLARCIRVTVKTSLQEGNLTPVVRRHLSGHFRGNKATRHGNEQRRLL